LLQHLNRSNDHFMENIFAFALVFHRVGFTVISKITGKTTTCVERGSVLTEFLIFDKVFFWFR